MIKAEFFSKNGHLSGFSVSGHSGYGTRGNDICCASVSSASQLVINTVTEFFGCEADVEVHENELVLKLKEKSAESEKLIESFKTHLGFIKEEFPQGISISVREITI